MVQMEPLILEGEVVVAPDHLLKRAVLAAQESFFSNTQSLFRL